MYKANAKKNGGSFYLQSKVRLSLQPFGFPSSSCCNWLQHLPACQKKRKPCDNLEACVGYSAERYFTLSGVE